MFGTGTRPVPPHLEMLSTYYLKYLVKIPSNPKAAPLRVCDLMCRRQQIMKNPQNKNKLKRQSLRGRISTTPIQEIYEQGTPMGAPHRR